MLDSYSRRDALLAGATFGTLAIGGAAAFAAPAVLPARGADALRRARGVPGLKTRYLEGDGMPQPGKPWPGKPVAATDCSGFVLWCFGLARDPRLGGGRASTNDIYADALLGSKSQLFRRVDEPRVGGIIVYPRFRIAPDIGDSGHVGIIAAIKRKRGTGFWNGGVKEEFALDIIDCSSTAWWTYGDAVSHGGYQKFLLHDQMMAYARTREPGLGDLARSPIYAISNADA